MKRIVVLLSLVAVFFTVQNSLAVTQDDISKNVDTIVSQIESGIDVTTIKPDSVAPYAFIMREDGKMLVHPTLSGKSMKKTALPIYTALMKANSEGVWVEYEWKGKMKHTYAKRTKNNLIVGSGY